MEFTLAPLPFSLDALEPFISRRTLEFHYGKHHKAYVDKANALIMGTDHEKQESLDVVLTSTGKVFNNAAQAWNHEFFWKCLSGDRAAPSSFLTNILRREFGGLEEFKARFLESAKEHFGSGWTWLVKTPSGTLKIVSLQNAGNPMLSGEVPLLTCDIWEHAYYLDYQNDRAAFLENFWEIIHWRFVEERLEAALPPPSARRRTSEERFYT